MAEREAQRVEQRMGFVGDAAPAAYVDAIGQRLAAHSLRRDVQYQFHVVDMPVRPLEPAERASIRENRLRIIEARQDEELGALIARSKGRWGTPMTAVVNALSADQLLGAGQLVKLAIAEPYLRAAR